MRRFLGTLTLLSLPWFLLGAIWNVSSKQKPVDQDREPATKIEPGVMSEKQKEHSKLYDKGYTKGQGRLDEDPLNQRVRDFQANMYKPPGLEHVVDHSISAAQFMQRQSCAADAVVAGEVLDKASQLVESAQFLFTEYTVRITDVYKNNALSEVLPGSEITVVRPGGKVEIRGRIVKTTDARFLPLMVGSRVLLFLKYIPKTGSYDSAFDRGSFEFRKDMLVPLTEQDISGFGSKDGVPFGANITAAIATGCSR